MKGKPFRDQDNRALHERRMKERTRIVVTQKNIEYILAHQHEPHQILSPENKDPGFLVSKKNLFSGSPSIASLHGQAFLSPSVAYPLSSPALSPLATRP